MKTRGLVLFLIIAMSYNLNAQNFDFRNTKWGMDSTQVKRAETAKLTKSKKNSLVYYGKLGDLDSKIVYTFSLSDKLSNATYFINMESKNPQVYVNTYLMLEELLTQKYKNPIETKNSTINGKVISQGEWASNLISNNLNLETKWKNDRSIIILSLYSINDELFLEVNYNSLDINNTIEQKTLIIKDL